MSLTAVTKLGFAPALALGALLQLSACAYGQMSQVLRADVASESDCPSLVVKKTSPFSGGYQPNQYSVRGCNIDRVYTCKGEGLAKFGSAATDCSFTASGQQKPAAGPQPAEPSPEGDEPAAEDDLSNG
ncbi:MAG: hypothetical protein ABW321_11975 [Polyangiales bacterium]